MGLSDAGVFLADQKSLGDMELGFLQNPNLGLSSDQIIYTFSQDDHEEIADGDRHEDKHESSNSSSSSLSVKVRCQPEYRVFTGDGGCGRRNHFGDKQKHGQPAERGQKRFREDYDDDDEEEDCCKTPTRSDQIIPAMPKRCPAAPRKRRKPPSSRNVKTISSSGSRTSRVFLDVSREIESLFPSAFMADLENKIKKARDL